MGTSDDDRGDSVSEIAEKAAERTWFENAARAGQFASGCVHILIAYIILRLAFGGGGNADQSGALGIFAESAGGRIALWLAVIVFAALALWRIVEAILGPHPGESRPSNSHGDEDTGWTDRAKALGLAAVYIAFAYSAAQFALGHGQSSGQQNAGLSARLMGSTGGKALLVVVGLVVIAIGGYHIYKGATRRFLDDLKRGGDSPLIVWSGVIGYVAKGAALTGAGVLVIVAAVRADPAKATGIDGAVKTLAGLPAGQLLLVLAAFGIAAYGFYSFVMARHARM
ncbi:DUF1206 domain-containing protein [Gordonia sp. ABSL49_1]|nr:DUF1206 domain-containing protein [Gordonia sp. ABSL49_1]MCH5641170.1 DUF1206 domain-containing protein [Gordonia sp. ABSL49_1]